MEVAGERVDLAFGGLDRRIDQGRPDATMVGWRRESERITGVPATTITMDETRLAEFVAFARELKGDEKSEAQTFLTRLFQAFGHAGAVEAGATFEHRIRIEKATTFADLLWPGRVLIEMKSRGVNLDRVVPQAKAYWDNAYKDRTEYVVLCNFDEFVVYNWNLQREPLDRVPLERLPEMWRSLAFLATERVEPIFGNNLVALTKEAADRIADLHGHLVDRGIAPATAQRFVLQCLVALFAEDTGLFPDRYTFSSIIEDCRKGQSSYDLFHLLFSQMNSSVPAAGGRFRGVPYFDGGIFAMIDRIELDDTELELLDRASKSDWSKVQPSIFGNIFEDSLEAGFRHASGAHYTAESDIMRIVEPTVLRPWRERIAGARTLGELEAIAEALGEFQVLDPACGSGNFLYVAFRELKELERGLFATILERFPSIRPERVHSRVSARQFHGIDTNPLGVEMAKITLSMAKKFAADDFNRVTQQHRFFDEAESPLPFDNLEDNIVVADALFSDWPAADAIIGNPPYQAQNAMLTEFGQVYVNRLRLAYPDISGYADYCVYWFRKAHDHLRDGGRAGLVGTNTIRQNLSRESGLDYIVQNDGTIVEAVGTMPWSGEAAVHVSVVNWVKRMTPKGPFFLAVQKGDDKKGPWEEYSLASIPSSLSPTVDVASAVALRSNVVGKVCYKGQMHGHAGFLLSPAERMDLLAVEPSAAEVTFPFLIAEDLIGRIDSLPSRYAIDFQPRDIYEAKGYKQTFSIIENKVLPTRKEAYEMEQKRNRELLSKNPTARVDRHYEGYYKRWWLHSFGRWNLIKRLEELPRYIVCGEVTKRPIFTFTSSEIHPNKTLVVFLFSDDFSFGILQSGYHWAWFTARCSTLKGDYRYTSNTVFDSFPWPQWGAVTADEEMASARSPRSPVAAALAVAEAARDLRRIRAEIRAATPMSLRELYRTLELPGANRLRDAQEALDKAVAEAYAWGLPPALRGLEPLPLLLALNQRCASLEREGRPVTGPGLPVFCEGDERFQSDDCLKMP
ncbi:MAG: DNA methyltransferase [Methanoregulaceae archaeon]